MTELPDSHPIGHHHSSIPRSTSLPPLVASCVRSLAPPGPLVLSSPHSGMVWPVDFAPDAPQEAILTTWDACVDELWAGAVGVGARLLAAHFPRAYVDVNRAISDLDPEIVDEAWPDPVEPTDYSRRGMGLIRRLALPGVPMYDRPLSRAAVKHRLTTYYQPYRAALAALVDDAHARHGVVCHVDCHSMKSRGNRMNVDAGSARPDIVVSDRRGTTAAPGLTAWVAEFLAARGYVVRVNDPYQGGDLVRTVGRPADGRHAVQVEVNRACYMDEAAFTPHDGFGRVRDDLTALARALTDRLSGGLGTVQA